MRNMISVLELCSNQLTGGLRGYNVATQSNRELEKGMTLLPRLA